MFLSILLMSALDVSGGRPMEMLAFVPPSATGGLYQAPTKLPDAEEGGEGEVFTTRFTPRHKKKARVHMSSLPKDYHERRR